MRQTLISWAATSCFLILAVIALRAVFGKRMGAGLRYALWGLVLVRLLVPVQLFTSPVAGTVIDSERIVTKETKTEREVLGAPPVDSAQVGPGLEGFVPYAPNPPAMPDAPPAPDAPDWREIPAALGWLWLAGGAVMALVLAGCNLKFWWMLRRTRRAIASFSREKKKKKELYTFTQESDSGPLPEVDTLSVCAGNGSSLPVYAAENLPSPCLFGVFRPAIYVAAETAADPAALRHVLAHEDTHFRHGDHIWSLLRCAALCVHWWNPLVWLAAKLSRRDGELACDEGALKRLGDGERTAYGNTLLALVTAKAAPGGMLTCSTAMTGDKRSLTERFARIARAPKRVMGIGLAAIILAALVTVCAFGQKTSTPASWEELEADLSLTVEDDGTVRITGTVDGVTLVRRGAFWHSGDRPYSFSGSPYGELSLIYPAFTEGIEGHLLAWWADEGHTAVNLSTYLMAGFSSYWPSGYWEFTVDFSGGEAVVTRMEAIADFPEGMEIQMHPKTIPDEEAVRAGRIAARLLTSAEQYWEDTKEKGIGPRETEPPAPSETLAPSAEEAPKWYVCQLLGDMLDCKDWAVEFWLSPGSEPVRVDMNSARYGDDIRTVFGSLEWVKVDECPDELYPAGVYVVNLSAARGSIWCRSGSDFIRVDESGTEMYFRAVGAGALWSILAHLSEPALAESPASAPASARAELKAALLGETDFTFCNEQGQPTAVNITTAPQTVFPLTGEYGEIWGFYVVDLDGDGAEEVVLHIGGVAGDAGGYLVLRWAGPGDVRGYSSYWRNFWDLKADGTFDYDYYTGGGTARVSFGSYTMTQHPILEGHYLQDGSDPPKGTFTVDGGEATWQEYEAAVDKQKAKPDAAWYEFTEENIQKALG